MAGTSVARPDVADDVLVDRPAPRGLRVDGAAGRDAVGPEAGATGVGRLIEIGDDVSRRITDDHLAAALGELYRELLQRRLIRLRKTPGRVRREACGCTEWG